MNIQATVRTELVEGAASVDLLAEDFFAGQRKTWCGFDKLSPNGGCLH
jgi:hypothetical protein